MNTMETKLTREEVYEIIDTERDYQDNLWLNMDGSKHMKHSPEEWLVYIDDYSNEAKHIMSRQCNDVAVPQAMNIIRKIAAMAVCAIQQHGCEKRNLSDTHPTK